MRLILLIQVHPGKAEIPQSVFHHLAFCLLQPHKVVSVPDLPEFFEQTGILAEFSRLRTTDETIYLRNSSINRINGMIGMTFSCDGAHYIDHKTFFEKLETFATSGGDDILHSVKCR